MEKLEKFDVDFDMPYDDRPYVEIEFCGKDFKWRKAMMLIDTGAGANFLQRRTKRFIGENHFRPNQIIIACGLGGSTTLCSAVDFVFRLGSEFFAEEFYIRVDDLCNLNDPTPDEGDSWEDGCVAGTLGVNFLKKYKLVLDFHNLSIHSPYLERNKINKRNCRYIMDMYSSDSMEMEDCPYLYHYDRGCVYKILLDSGSNWNLIASSILKESSYQRVKGQKKYTICGPAKSIDVVPIVFALNLSSQETFFQERIYFYPEFGKARNPLGNNYYGSVSAGFMFDNRWTLDFCHGIMYRLKRFPRYPVGWFEPGDQ